MLQRLRRRTSYCKLDNCTDVSASQTSMDVVVNTHGFPSLSTITPLGNLVYGGPPEPAAAAGAADVSFSRSVVVVVVSVMIAQ